MKKLAIIPGFILLVCLLAGCELFVEEQPLIKFPFSQMAGDHTASTIVYYNIDPDSITPIGLPMASHSRSIDRHIISFEEITKSTYIVSFPSDDTIFPHNFTIELTNFYTGPYEASAYLNGSDTNFVLKYNDLGPWRWYNKVIYRYGQISGDLKMVSNTQDFYLDINFD